MGDGFDHKKSAATPGRNPAAAGEQPAVPGKRTRVELCYESGPDLAEMMQRFRDRTPSALDQPRLDPEEIKRRIAESIERAKEMVIGELPLGGWLAAPRGEFEEHVRKDEGKIISRTLDAATSTLSGSVAAAARASRGESSIMIMRRAEAAAVVEHVAMSVASAAQPTAQPTESRESSRGAPLEPEAHRPAATAPAAPRAPAPERSPEREPLPAALPKETDPIHLEHDMFTKVADPVVVEIRYTKAMQKSPADACFFKAGIEWVQRDIQLRTGKRSPDDAKARREARVIIKNQGVDITKRDASHPLDSIINVLFVPANDAYYFAHESVNRSLGAQLRKLGKLPEGTAIYVKFVDFPDEPPGQAPPTVSNRIKE